MCYYLISDKTESTSISCIFLIYSVFQFSKGLYNVHVKLISELLSLNITVGMLFSLQPQHFPRKKKE